MSVPVEQLEISIPQGYSLFIKTIFQARSFTKPLELQFEVQIEYLASFPTSPRPCGQPPYIWPSVENFPIPCVERKALRVAIRHPKHLYGI
uniref:Uncharacterized protein n=1 Tax=Ursus americanus TaxID=9643 RepID=A0A452RVX0_URSAM